MRTQTVAGRIDSLKNLETENERIRMPTLSAEKRLQRLSKLKAAEISLLKEGVSLENTFSRTLDDLMAQVAADRLNLSKEFLRMAENLRRSRTDYTRAAIARYYYSMYHAMRSASFYANGGDDHEQHTELSQSGVPKDFPNRAITMNTLKDARLRRNEADYEAYPGPTAHYKIILRGLAPTAVEFVRDVDAYLTSKGNPYI